MEYYPRTLQPRIENVLFKGKIIIIYGARQVGKTTLARALIEQYPHTALYLNCDEPDIRSALTDRTSTELKQLLGNNTLIVVDEAQRVRNIGLTLKLLVDNYPDIQVIATGSSSFQLSNTIAEPLTGRKITFRLLPLSVREILGQGGMIEAGRLLGRQLCYGMYPGVITSDMPELEISEIASSYLYRDVLEYQVVKKPEALHRLLQALALQSSEEVSYNELGSLLGLDRQTVERYMALLEQAFIIFQLPSFSRNLRKELGKRKKVYFYDLGIRNALLNHFNPVELRADIGGLWENFFISERLKFLTNGGERVNTFFWRLYQGSEIDYLEEKDGQLTGFECKWRAQKWRPSRKFLETYPNSQVHLVHSSNFLEFL